MEKLKPTKVILVVDAKENEVEVLLESTGIRPSKA